MKLANVTIHKYKSIETDQSFNVDDSITVLVGMNEAGKTSVLEAIAKTNYFTDDKRFTFDTTHDYPRREKKKLDKSGEIGEAITLSFDVDDNLQSKIDEDLGNGIMPLMRFDYLKKYDLKGYFSNYASADKSKFIDNKLSELGINDGSLSDRLKKCINAKQFAEILASVPDDETGDGEVGSDTRDSLSELQKYFKNSWDWADPISEYVMRVHVKPNMPKFLYYDEYYSLPSEVIIEKLSSGSELSEEENKTARALFELADIDIDELLNADDFEDYVAELEATQALITDELFKFWSANKNLKIKFAIDKIVKKSTNANNNR